jgi:4-coumarate--CoA ligase
LPLFHAASNPVAVITPFRAGHATYVMRRFELETYLANIEKYSITELAIVPPIAIAIIMSPITKKYSLKSIRQAACGAAPLGKGPQARLRALLAEDAPFTQVWGMTETSCVASMFYYPEDDVTGSVGRMLPNLDVKLVDEDGKDITAYNVRGEICIRGPTITKGYFENPEANKRDWDEGGYFHTGDIAYCDSKTQLYYIVDRRKVSSGFSISFGPDVVYSAINTHLGTHQSPRLPGRSRRTRGHAPLPSQDHRCGCHWR